MTALIGSLAFVAFVLNTCCCFPFLMAVTLVRVALPVPIVVHACRRMATAIGETWIGFNVLGLKAAGRMSWSVTQPSGLERHAWYLVTCNHRSWVDIVIVQWLFNRRIPLLKFFLKRELFWVPVLGLSWWALEFPFMRRFPRAVLERRPDLKHKDLETTRRACERFRTSPASVLNFVEGTRFSEVKRDLQSSPYVNLLVPRAGGVAQVIAALGSQLEAWLDVTILYPAGTPTFWHLISGQIPAVVVHVESVPFDRAWSGRDYETDAGFRESFQQFLRELWVRKDRRITEMLGSTPDASRGTRSVSQP